VDSFPDLDPLRDEELKDLSDQLVAEERDVVRTQSGGSYKLRILHGKIDIIRAELAARRRRREGGDGPSGSSGSPDSRA
jgi:anti-sigma-K factor RsiG